MDTSGRKWPPRSVATVNVLLFGLVIIIIMEVGADELPHDESQVISSNACFSKQTQSLRLVCPPGHMVKLLKVFYGYSPSGGCAYNQGDCTKDLPAGESYPCIGRRQCDINMPQTEQGKWIPNCQQYSSYAQANYACVPEPEVRDVCEHPELHDQSGYIRSPHYPNNYPESVSCSLTIRTPFSGQRIRLYIIDLNLESADNHCIDSLHVFDWLRDNTVCESRSKRYFFTSQHNKMRIGFNSSVSVVKKGFWLYYEASPYMTTTEAPSTEAAMITTSAAQEPVMNSTERNGTSAVPKVNANHADGFPIGLLLGAMFGLVICILATLLLILVFKSRRLDPQKLPPTMSTSSTTAIIEDDNMKNNLVKCNSIAYNNMNTTLPCKDTKYKDLDLDSAKVMGKDIKVVDDVGDWKQKSWKEPKDIGSMC